MPPKRGRGGKTPATQRQRPKPGPAQRTEGDDSATVSPSSARQRRKSDEAQVRRTVGLGKSSTHVQRTLYPVQSLHRSVLTSQQPETPPPSVVLVATSLEP